MCVCVCVCVNIIIGNGHGDQNLNPIQGCLHFQIANILGEGMNQTILPPAMHRIVRSRLLILGRQLV